MTGIRSDNLSVSNLADDILGNWEGSTRRIPVDRLVAQVAALMGPSYATRSELLADRSWPAGAVGYVRADSNVDFNGVYKKSGAIGSGTWTRIGSLPSGAVERELIDAVRADVDNKAPLAATPRMFALRGEAVAVGQQSLPDTIGHVLIRAGDWIEVRGPGQRQDELFATYPWWGLLFRVPNEALLQAERSERIAAIRDAGVLPLVNVSGADQITASLLPSLIDGGVTLSGASSVELIPTATNTGAVTLDLGDGPIPVRAENGATLNAGELVVGRSYILRRRGNVWRIASGGVALVDMATEISARVDATNSLQANIDSEAQARAAGDNAILTEVRDGRVWHTSNSNLSTQTPPAGTDQISVTTTSGHAVYWRLSSAPGTIDPAVHVQTSDGTWWRLSENTSAIKGRTDVLALAVRSGMVMPTNVLPETPGSEGQRINLELASEVTAAGITTVPIGAQFRYIPTVTNSVADPTIWLETPSGTLQLNILNSDGATWYPGDFVVGRQYTLRRTANRYARVVAGEVVDADVVALQASLQDSTNGLQANIDAEAQARVAGDTALQEQIDIRPTRDDLNMDPPIYPGDDLLVLAEDKAGRPVLGVDSKSAGLWPHVVHADDLDDNLLDLARPDTPPYPGDDLLTIIATKTGEPVLGVSDADGTLWPNVAASGGAAVDFVPVEDFGNAWMAIRSSDELGEIIRFMSNKWAGRTIGFERRSDVTIAQTYGVAVGVVAFGGGVTGAPVAGNEYPYHLLGPDMKRLGDGLDAQRVGVEWLRLQDEAHDGLPTTFGVSHSVPSTLEADALDGSEARIALVNKVRAVADAARTFGKQVYIDRIGLSLLDGALDTSQAAADLHYAGVANSMRMELAEATGQQSFPVIIVCQSFGTRTDGTSGVILAEGRLHWMHWSIGICVATPRYPFPLAEFATQAHTDTALLQIAELQALAAHERLAGRDWFCPSLEEASISGATITARFVSMTGDIVLRDPDKHGFSVNGITNGATITGVSVSGSYATISLSEPPAGANLTLDYAFGRTGMPGDAYAVNRGSITDSWSRASAHGGTLYRYALSNRVAIDTE